MPSPGWAAGACCDHSRLKLVSAPPGPPVTSKNTATGSAWPSRRGRASLAGDAATSLPNRTRSIPPLKTSRVAARGPQVPEEHGKLRRPTPPPTRPFSLPRRNATPPPSVDGSGIPDNPQPHPSPATAAALTSLPQHPPDEDTELPLPKIGNGGGVPSSFLGRRSHRGHAPEDPLTSPPRPAAADEGAVSRSDTEKGEGFDAFRLTLQRQQIPTP